MKCVDLISVDFYLFRRQGRHYKLANEEPDFHARETNLSNLYGDGTQIMNVTLKKKAQEKK